MRKHLIMAASALAVGLASATAASAQDYGRMVSFGDSLSDIGNLYSFTAGGAPASPPYYQGRYSNGPVWLELLGFTQARYNQSVTGSYNGAFGGSRTDTVATPGPGMRTQINNYLAAGGTFGATDLVTIWGGANNIFQGAGPASTSPDPFGSIAATSTAAAADMGFMVNQVANAGAGTVLVANLPNLGATPQFAGTTGQALATHATNVFNAALFAQMSAQAAAHPNTNIILMDVNRAFTVVQQSPGRFGFTNVTQGCLLVACSTPDSYSYWDTVHPTAAGHRLIAGLATDYLYYADFGAHAAVQAEIAGRSREDSLSASTDRLGQGGFEGRAAGAYIAGEYNQSSLDARGEIQGGDLDGSTLTIGVESNIGSSLRGGVSFTARTADADLTLVNFTAESAGFDAYLGWRSGPIFVNSAVGYSVDQYEDINRQTPTPNVIATAGTEGQTMGARIEGGYAFAMGQNWSVAPRVGLSWTSTDVDGYAEQNAFGVQHQFDDRSLDVTSAEVAVRADGDVGGFGVWGEVGYRDAIDYSGDPVVVRIAGNTAQPLSVDAGDPNGGQVMLGLGVRGSFGPADVSIGYRGRSGDSYDSHAGVAQVTLRF